MAPTGPPVVRVAARRRGPRLAHPTAASLRWATGTTSRHRRSRPGHRVTGQRRDAEDPGGGHAGGLPGGPARWDHLLRHPGATRRAPGPAGGRHGGAGGFLKWQDGAVAVFVEFFRSAAVRVHTV